MTDRDHFCYVHFIFSQANYMHLVGAGGCQVDMRQFLLQATVLLVQVQRLPPSSKKQGQFPFTDASSLSIQGPKVTPKERVQTSAPFPSHQSAYPSSVPVTRIQVTLCLVTSEESEDYGHCTRYITSFYLQGGNRRVTSLCYYWNTTLQFPDMYGVATVLRPGKPLDRHAYHHQ